MFCEEVITPVALNSFQNMRSPSKKRLGKYERFPIASGRRKPGLIPKTQETVDFLQTLCCKILEDLSFKSQPEIIALASWFQDCRKIHDAFESKRKTAVWLGRGLVIHMCGSRRDILFLYPLFFSILVGN